MDKTCYNPYHFVPVTKRTASQTKHDLDREHLATPQAGSTTHERYVPGTHSCRLVCKLTTKTPLVIGSEQTRRPGEMGHVKPYEVMAQGDTEMRPAIPGSSLRGLMSSLAEAASNSALRVLTGGAYSFRKPFEPKHTLSALGLVIGSEATGWKLKPVALPTLALAGRHYEVPRKFRLVFPRPVFKVFDPDYPNIRRDIGKRTWKKGLPFAPMAVKRLVYNKDGHVDSDPSLHCKPNPNNPKFAVSQKPGTPGAEKLSGMLRVLGCWGDREDEIPTGKKHELWLSNPTLDTPAIPIDPKAVEKFYALSDERTEDSLKGKGPLLPFHPLDTERNEDSKQGRKFRLKAGDLVYFDVNEARTLQESRVTEIALSAIWRGRVETSAGQPAGAMEFFEAVDPELVPFSPARKKISIAERMFGFVQDEKSEDQTQAPALAGRIRFSDALLPQGVSRDAALEEKPVPLRILSSPKPPSPALYFKPGKGPGAWIAKVDLKPGKDHPQGRKMYLHHYVKPGTRPWETKHPTEHKDQKNMVRPVREGQEFFFHIDFDNLTGAEMGVLLYSLAPDDKFHHKLGMGKPLGLGSVKIEIAEWRQVDRLSRYTVAGLRAPRNSAVIAPHDAAFWALRNQVISDALVSREIHNAICTMGNFEGRPPSAEIHTPTLADQLDPEVDTYTWFVANDGGLKEKDVEINAQRKSLPPLSESPGRLPKLPRPDWTPRQRRPY